LASLSLFNKLARVPKAWTNGKGRGIIIPMRIGIDIDNTITNTRETILAFLERYALARSLPYSFDPSKYTLEEALSWEPRDLDGFIEQHLTDVYREVAPKSHAVEVIRDLHSNDYIALITSRNRRNGNIHAITLEWLARNQVQYDLLIMNETENMHHFSKLAACRENSIQVMIEDHDGLALELSHFIPVVLFDYPYNTNIRGDNIIRVQDWLQVPTALVELAARPMQRS